MSIRTLNWYESEADATSIIANNWNLQVAKSVATGSAAPTYNIVWQSQAIAPSTQISWKVQYALAWTAVVPSEGVTVKIRGNWQKCDKGESYDINPLGYWQKSDSAGQAGWLNVGKIDYSYPGVLGIHIVVGVLNAQTGRYEPIFVDGATLPIGSSAKYQPQETVSWWLDGKDLTGQVFNSTKSRSTSYDFSNPSDPVTNTYEWSTSFVMIGGKWTIAPGSPPQSLTAPPPSAALATLSLGGPPPVVLQLDHASWLVTFAKPLAVAALGAIGAALYERLKGNFKKLVVTIDGTDGTRLRFEYEAGGNGAPGTVEFLGTPVGSGGGPADRIDGVLRELLASRTIPDGESWQIAPTTKPAALGDVRPIEESPVQDDPKGHDRFSNSYQPAVTKSPFSQGFSNGIRA